jgi:S-methylmethionine-dependent homocysteine/selenocysteine methylase
MPVWVSFTLRDDLRGILRSHEPLEQAIKDVVAIKHAPEAFLVNCCSADAVLAALPTLAGQATGAEVPTAAEKQL